MVKWDADPCVYFEPKDRGVPMKCLGPALIQGEFGHCKAVLQSLRQIELRSHL